MNDRISKLLSRGILLAGLTVACGGFTACSDDYDLDDKGNFPSWLGESIYEELKNPNQEKLTGTFTNYLRLIDDLGYTEILSKTGSKTVFPANDEAFSRFFANNEWGVTKYEDLSNAQKKMLLYGSMLDNALLVEMFSNVSDGETAVTSGTAMKHTSGLNVIDTITHFYNRGEMPQNNTYWDRFAQKGIDLVMDATRPMLVHFTGEQLIQNNITTTGTNSDFEVVTGKTYSDENNAFVYRDPIIKKDVTCQNGYIQQVQDVLVPPGTIAEVLRNNGESNLFSRMLERFSVPFYTSSTTVSYNDYAQANNLPLIDSVYQKRFFSDRSQGEALKTDPNGNQVSYSLAFDPGWNAYTNGYNNANPLSDVCAIFAPTDKAMIDYFVNSGTGRSIITRYGKLPNTEANLAQNLDSIPINIVQTFVRDLMKPSFIDAVPSKFENVVHDGSGDMMGITLDDINKNSDGSYDVKIGDNGVAYMMNRVFVPDEWASVLGPLLHSSDKLVFYYLTQLGSTNAASNAQSVVNINFYAYLLSMKSNFALIAPNDKAFDKYYLDPTSLGHSNNQQRMIHFYLNKKSPYNFSASTWTYNPETGELSDSTKLSDNDASYQGIGSIISQIKDILNTHTIVLSEGETLGTDKYYISRSGAGIEYDGKTFRGGAQIDNGRPESNVVEKSTQTNGTTYVTDHIVEPATNSVWKVLNDNADRFQKFTDLCTGKAYNSELTKNEMLVFAGISTTKDPETQSVPANAYRIFTDENTANSGLDRSVYFFNSFNYTVYAPDDAAMDSAYSKGLPSWDDVAEVVAQGDQLDDGEEKSALKTKALAMIEEINDFIRYHFQDNSVFADKSSIRNAHYQTAYTNEVGVPVSIVLNRANNVITLTDASGATQTISASGNLLSNKMTRDFIFDSPARSASTISTSSFAVVHEINKPLCFNTSGTFDAWKNSAHAKVMAAKALKRLKHVRY